MELKTQLDSLEDIAMQYNDRVKELRKLAEDEISSKESEIGELEEENQDNHALFRYLPELKRKIAWRKLGNYPTPIHRGTYNYISKDQNAKEI